ncbi:MAG: hypothetical protein JZU49_03645, partial [Sulfuricurvum sp.]|nr:hypothetical protein [Sulfuricurvum sp.]
PFGVFFSVYSGMKDGLCPRTVFRQTQKTRNVCLKRRFQFVGRRLQIENPFPFARKEFAYFYAPLRCTPLRFKKANTFLQRSDQPGLEILKIIFAREQKCIINYFGLAFAGEMVVINTTFVLEKFFITVFPLKDFFISSLKFALSRSDQDHGFPLSLVKIGV